MPVYSYKCQNCGAPLEFEGEGEVIVCRSCGVGSTYERDGEDFTFFSVDVNVTNQTIIENATIVTSGPGENVQNLASLMEEAHRANNHRDCYRYASRILELDPKHPMAWFYKGLSAGYTSSLAAFRSQEVLTCYRNALKNANQKEKETLKWKAGSLVKLARDFVGQSRDHTIAYGFVDSVHSDHVQDIMQACSMLLDVYTLSGSKAPLKAVAEMTESSPDLRGTHREALNLLADQDPAYVKQKRKDKSTQNAMGCGCGLVLLAVVGGALYLILK